MLASYRYLAGNLVDCSAAATLQLILDLALSNIIADINLLRCTNGTKVQDLLPDEPTPSATSTTYIVTPTSVMSPSYVATSYVATTSDNVIAESTSFPVTVSPTPMLSEYCESETSLTAVGFIDWPRTLESIVATVPCPSDQNAASVRLCLHDGEWGMIDLSQCELGSDIVQVLAKLKQV